jgi:hypothetical protein
MRLATVLQAMPMANAVIHHRAAGGVVKVNFRVVIATSGRDCSATRAEPAAPFHPAGPRVKSGAGGHGEASSDQ